MSLESPKFEEPEKKLSPEAELAAKLNREMETRVATFIKTGLESLAKVNPQNPEAARFAEELSGVQKEAEAAKLKAGLEMSEIISGS